MDSIAGVTDKISAAESPEKKEQVVFQWLYLLEKDLSSCSEKDLLGAQPDIEKALFQLLTSTAPKPTRPVRQTIGRILSLLYRQGESRSLFDSIAKMHTHFANKKLDDPLIKIALIYCVGSLSENVGEKVLSLYPESAAMFIKGLKATRDPDLGLRNEAIRAFSRSLIVGGKTLSEATIKEIVKLAKAGLIDKNLAIRSGCSKLLVSLYKHCNVARPTKPDELETLILAFVKSVEGAHSGLRKDIAALIGTVLVLSLQGSPSKANANDKRIQPVLVLDDVLGTLNACIAKLMARDFRETLFLAYIETIRFLGVGVLEANYLAVVKQLISLLGNPKLAINVAETVWVKGFCNCISREILRIISESAQVMALKDLSTSFLPQDSKESLSSGSTLTDLQLVFVLEEISHILDIVGTAALPVEENIVEPLFCILPRPSRLSTFFLSKCLRSLCLALPKNLPRFLDRLFNLLQKEITALTSDKIPELSSRFYNVGSCLAGVIGVIPKHALNVSFDSVASIFSTSTQLLKISQNAKDAKLALGCNEVAWLLLGSLFCLGPNFVRVHLTQVLMIWKTAFPKPSSKEQGSTSDSEWLFHISCRDNALAGLSSFLTFNALELLSVDVAKRVVVYLNNVLGFITMIPHTYQSASMALKHRLVTAEFSLKMRLFKCFYNMRPLSSFETSFELLVKLSVETFLPDPESFDRTIIGSNDKQVPSFEFLMHSSVDIHYMTSDDDNSTLKSCDGLANSGDFIVPQFALHLNSFAPMQFDIDPHSVYMINSHSASPVFPMNADNLRPFSVIAVDNAIELFSLLFCALGPKIQGPILERITRISKHLNSGKITLIRKSALQRNMLISLRGMLKAFSAKKLSIPDESLVSNIRAVAEDFMVSTDSNLRLFACDILGRLCRSSPAGPFINNLIQSMVDRIINIRDPDQRSGCALALGFVNSYVGGMASSSHLKTIVGILHSLSSDPNALVHTWSLQSLWMVVESAGVMYGSFTNSTLSLVVKLFMSESHDYYMTSQQGSLSLSNIACIFGKLLYGLIGVVGPELQASSKVRELCFGLFHELRNDTDPYVVIEAVRCIQYFILFSPKYLDMIIIIPFLQEQLRNHGSNHAPLRKAAVTCLYQMTQRDPGLVLNAASGKQLEEQLFALLDVETEDMVRSEIKDVITGLLKHVVLDTPSKWINICKNIVAKGGVSTSHLNLNLEAQDAQQNDDDDDSTLSKPAQVPKIDSKAKTSKSLGDNAVVLMPRWKTQVFAIQCLRKILQLLSASNMKQHVDLIAARESLSDGKQHDYLAFRLTDLVKIAFSCATATAYELRLEGLSLLSDIIEVFSAARDPDFQESALLEQYQAQISAALTPAFNEDALPVIQALACRVCAAYVGSGINTDVSSLSRVYPSLILSEDFIKRTSANEIAMLKISALTAWSQLTLSASKYPYLSSIVAPNLSRLVKSWFELLRDYAHLKADLDAISPLSLLHNHDSPTQNANMYMAATRDIILPYYKECWHIILESLASLVDSNIALLVNVLESQNNDNSPSRVCILTGLCIESASYIGFGFDRRAPSENDKLSAAVTSREEQARISLLCLKKLMRPEILAPTAFLVIYPELIVVLEKIIQSSDSQIQMEAIYILKESEAGEQKMTKEIWNESSFLALWKVLMNSFIYHIPSLSLNPMTTYYLLKSSEQERSKILLALLDALHSAMKLEGLNHLHYITIVPQALFVILEVLEDNSSSPEIANLVLFCLKSILERAGSVKAEDTVKLSKPFQSFSVSLIEKLQMYMEDKDASVQQIKNISLCIAACLSSSSPLLQNKELVQRAASIFTDLLNMNDQFSEIAVGCVRVIFSQLDYERISPVHSVLLRELLPLLFAFTINGRDTLELEIYQELLKIFAGLALVLPKEYMVTMLRALASMTSQSGSDSQKDRVLAATLLQTAAKKQTEFRFALMQLSPDDRGAVERSLKSLVASNAETASVKKEVDQETSQPKIKLKAFF
ncbi:hypothetical protein HDU67_010163 [Dinochytrium kinnereticum]|nr:hypothetical protein HDU67_010163 [Dinochytrium kinnereticum]